MSSSANITGDEDLRNFYDLSLLEPHLIYQGEVLADVPLLSSEKPKRWLLLRTQSGRPLDEALQQGRLGGKVNVLDSNMSREQWDGSNMGDFTVARLDKRPVLVLTQTCSIEHADFIQVAPIFEVPPVDVGYLQRLKKSDLNSAFWLPPHPPQIEKHSYADLELVQAVHKSYVKRITPDQHFRCTSTRTRELQRVITRYFGRPNAFDARHDRVPQTGTYLCVKCFYRDGRVSSVELAEQSGLAECTACGGIQWVLKDQ